MSDQLAGRLGSNCKWDYISLMASHQWSSERLCFRASSLQWLYKYVNHLDTGVEYILSKFVDDAELGRVVDSFEGRKGCRYTLIKLEGQESPTTWHLKIVSAGFCTGVGAILDLYQQTEGWGTGEQPHEKGFGGSGWTYASGVLWQPKGPSVTRCTSGPALPLAEGSGCTPLLCVASSQALGVGLGAGLGATM